MAYLLRGLNIIMIIAIAMTTLAALDLIDLSLSHISVAIPSYIYTIFAQAFIMFYFIGVAKLTNNVMYIIKTKTNLEEIFEVAPENLDPYEKKLSQFVHEANTPNDKLCHGQF